jgi:hypothetical protein
MRGRLTTFIIVGTLCAHAAAAKKNKTLPTQKLPEKTIAESLGIRNQGDTQANSAKQMNVDFSPSEPVIRVTQPATINSPQTASSVPQEAHLKPGKLSEVPEPSVQIIQIEQPAATPDSKSETVETSSPSKTFQEIPPSPTPNTNIEQPTRPAIQIGMGAIQSQWDKFDSSFPESSFRFRLSTTRQIDPKIEIGLGLEVLTASESTQDATFLGAWTLLLGGRWLPNSGQTLKPFAGSHFLIGRYRAWKHEGTSGDDSSFRRLGDGTLTGLDGELGLRILLGPRWFVDTAGTWTYFLGEKSSRVGGPGMFISLGFNHSK